MAALHVGTLGLVLEPLATALEAVVERLAGATTGFVDPNVRPAVIAEPALFRARLERVIARSDVVKVSRRTSPGFTPSARPPRRRALLERGPAAVLLTRGAQGATVVTAAADTPVAPAATEVVDTIGAGDAFGGGFLAWWFSHGLGREDLARQDRVVDAALFAAAVAARTVACAGASPPQAAGRPLEIEALA